MTVLYALKLFILLLFTTPSLAQATACYGMEGGQMNSNYAPCNASSTTHSACCNAANADICLSSGLCLSTVAVALGRVLWLNGCTDKTLKDPSCPQYCRNLKTGSANSYFLRACDQNETVNSWCCGVAGQSIDDCCSRSFKLRSNIGGLVEQLNLGGSGNGNDNSANANDGVPFETPSSFNQPPSTSTASQGGSTTTASLDSSPSNREGLIAGISVVSAIAAAAILALVVAVLRIRRLARRNDTLSSTTVAAAGDTVDGAAPQVVEQPSERSFSAVEPQRAVSIVHDRTTSHELSPISVTRPSLHEVSEVGECRDVRSSPGLGVSAEGSSFRWPVVIAELPADTVMKRD
ncbi:hypothetical protein SEUCBS140593_004058 [Sporothrix eucalyptigena]|uniref:Transmembrane protein n=1 Tax=Sporothrix eucalyptigena TaxID=1812306 RepID=A0ABP0BK80_9PEZI